MRLEDATLEYNWRSPSGRRDRGEIEFLESGVIVDGKVMFGNGGCVVSRLGKEVWPLHPFFLKWVRALAFFN